MHQYGYGVEKDLKTSVRLYKQAANLGNHARAFAKCGDYYYSQDQKKAAIVCYQKAAELGDVSALNSIGLMLEQGYDDVMPVPDTAV
jgi:hypothetical protein